MPRRCLALSILATLGGLTGLSHAATAHAQATATATLETAVKATYLYKFAPFVTWPAASTGPITLCIVGADPFGAQLDRAVTGQSVNGRPFQVVRLPTIAESSSCHIAYIGGSKTQPVIAALDTLHHSPVLTITDGANPPGMIDFVMEDGRVRFRIDQEAARDGGLAISSKLLSLAVTVRSRRVME